MRLSESIRSLLLEALQESFGPAKVYLFGSRVDDTRRGGDIDIALAAEMTREDFRRKRSAFQRYLLFKDFDLKVDLVLWNRHTNELLNREIAHNNIPLN